MLDKMTRSEWIHLLAEHRPGDILQKKYRGDDPGDIKEYPWESLIRCTDPRSDPIYDPPNLTRYIYQITPKTNRFILDVPINITHETFKNLAEFLTYNNSFNSLVEPFKNVSLQGNKQPYKGD